MKNTLRGGFKQCRPTGITAFVGGGFRSLCLRCTAPSGAERSTSANCVGQHIQVAPLTSNRSGELHSPAPLPNLCITTYNALARTHQARMDFLDTKLARVREEHSLEDGVCQALSGRALVACTVVTRREEDQSFMGVNHAYHTLVNGSDGVLKGILKGCAEQNALGALAAHGLSYRLVDRVYIAASCMPGKTPRATNTPIVNAKTVPFPCPECWSKFVQISHVRRDSGAAPLEVFVRCLPEEEHIVRIAGKARECARLQPTIRVTLVLDDGIYGDRQV